MHIMTCTTPNKSTCRHKPSMITRDFSRNMHAFKNFCIPSVRVIVETPQLLHVQKVLCIQPSLALAAELALRHDEDRDECTCTSTCKKGLKAGACTCYKSAQTVVNQSASRDTNMWVTPGPRDEIRIRARRDHATRHAKIECMFQPRSPNVNTSR